MTDRRENAILNILGRILPHWGKECAHPGEHAGKRIEKEGAALPEKLFGNHIEPACGYCRNGRPTADGRMILCPHAGVTTLYHACRKYRYDPLRRQPARQLELPEYDKADFEL